MRALWLAEKGGNIYEHPYDLGPYENLTTVRTLYYDPAPFFLGFLTCLLYLRDFLQVLPFSLGDVFLLSSLVFYMM